MEQEILAKLTTLGHAPRMAVFRLLSRRYPDAVPAGEIARALGLKPNTLSVYLAALLQAGLVSQTRQGTSLRYRVRWDAVTDMMTFLQQDCCRGRPDLCLPLTTAPDKAIAAMAERKLDVLFICSGNSARSILAEAILRHAAGARFRAHSAGTAPQAAPHPIALDLLTAKGIDTGMLRSKPLSEFQSPDAPKMDFVFTVCDRAANEDCPAWHGQPITGHWGVADPARATGTEAERRLAFEQVFDQLRNRIAAFAALPFDRLDRASLQRRVDDLASLARETA